jgi:hypothetical protein
VERTSGDGATSCECAVEPKAFVELSVASPRDRTGREQRAPPIGSVLGRRLDHVDGEIRHGELPRARRTPAAYAIISGDSRITQLIATQELPCSPIGKVLEHGLREASVKSNSTPKSVS